MSERTFTRAQVDQVLKPLLNIIAARPDGNAGLGHFTIPVSRDTSVEVRFHGPVGLDEYDSLIAHIAFYKTLLPNESEGKVDNRTTVEQVKSALREAGFDPVADGGAQ